VLAAEEQAASERHTIWLFSGMAAASLASGLALDHLPASSRDGHFDALDIAPLPLFVGSLTFGILAIVFGASS
jgi:hypothetical protein